MVVFLGLLTVDPYQAGALTVCKLYQGRIELSKVVFLISSSAYMSLERVKGVLKLLEEREKTYSIKMPLGCNTLEVK